MTGINKGMNPLESYPAAVNPGI